MVLQESGAIKLSAGLNQSRLAVFGGRGMSFNTCRGTLGSLAMFTNQERLVARKSHRGFF
jgi:hypothetical protein